MKVLAKAGPATTYQRRDHSHDIGSLATSSVSTAPTGASASSNATSHTPNTGLTDLDGSATSSYQDYSSTGGGDTTTTTTTIHTPNYNYKSSSYSSNIADNTSSTIHNSTG